MPALTVIPPSTITKENYDARAMAFIQREGTDKNKLPTISPGSPEFAAWERYFQDHLGFRPWALKAVKWGEIEKMTVPAQWPEWFDTNYAGGR